MEQFAKGHPEECREWGLPTIVFIAIITIYIILPIALIIGLVKLVNKIKRKKKSQNN